MFLLKLVSHLSRKEANANVKSVSYFGWRLCLGGVEYGRDGARPVPPHVRLLLLLHLVDLAVRTEPTRASAVCFNLSEERLYKRVRVPEGAGQLAEGGADLRLVGPAAGEQGVDGRRAVRGLVEPDAGLQVVDDLPVLQPEERLLSR